MGATDNDTTQNHTKLFGNSAFVGKEEKHTVTSYKGGYFAKRSRQREGNKTEGSSTKERTLSFTAYVLVCCYMKRKGSKGQQHVSSRQQ